MYAVAELNVRSHLRYVSANGHSQAVSMWAWPMTESSSVRVPFRCSYKPRRIFRESSHVVLLSRSNVLQNRFSSASNNPCHDLSVVPPSLARSASSLEITYASQYKSHACRSNRAISQRHG